MGTALWCKNDVEHTKLVVNSVIPDRPILCGTIVVRGNGAECCVNGDRLSIRAPRKVLEKLTVLCDGERDRDDVIRGLSDEWHEEDVRELMESLAEVGILQNANDQISGIWRLV